MEVLSNWINFLQDGHQSFIPFAATPNKAVQLDKIYKTMNNSLGANEAVRTLECRSATRHRRPRRRRKIPSRTSKCGRARELLSRINRDFDNNSGLNADRSNLLDDISGRAQVDKALMDAHLKAIPSISTLSTGRLAGGDLECLGGHADGALDAKVLVLGAADEVRANLLQALDVARRQCDADALLLDRVLETGLLDGGHFRGLVGERVSGSTGDLRCVPQR